VKHFLDLWNQVAKGIRSRCLIWAALGSYTSGDDENVENDAKQDDNKNDGCNGTVELPEIARECTTKKQQCNLQHQWQCLHHRVEVPGNDTVEFALSVLAPFYSGTPQVR